VSDLNNKQDVILDTVTRIERMASQSSNSSTPSLLVTPPLPSEIFTGRDDYLRKIESSFELPKTSRELKNQRRFVPYGTGGIGKTQLALKFLDANSNMCVH